MINKMLFFDFWVFWRRGRIDTNYKDTVPLLGKDLSVFSLTMQRYTKEI